MPDILPSFPVDDQTLNLVEEAINTHYGDVGEDGRHELVGGEFTLTQLLDFLSGYDPAKTKPMVNQYDTEIPDTVEYPDPVYVPTAVIQALINEVRRLRTTVSDYENRLTWDTTCANCAHLLDRLITEYERGHMAGLREGYDVADGVISAMWSTQDWEGQKPSMGYAATLDQELMERFRMLGVTWD